MSTSLEDGDPGSKVEGNSVTTGARCGASVIAKVKDGPSRGRLVDRMDRQSGKRVELHSGSAATAVLDETGDLDVVSCSIPVPPPEGRRKRKARKRKANQPDNVDVGGVIYAEEAVEVDDEWLWWAIQSWDYCDHFCKRLETVETSAMSYHGLSPLWRDAWEEYFEMEGYSQFQNLGGRRKKDLCLLDAAKRIWATWICNGWKEEAEEVQRMLATTLKEMRSCPMEEESVGLIVEGQWDDAEESLASVSSVELALPPDDLVNPLGEATKATGFSSCRIDEGSEIGLDPNLVEQEGPREVRLAEEWEDTFPIPEPELTTTIVPGTGLPCDEVKEPGEENQILEQVTGEWPAAPASFAADWAIVGTASHP